MRVLIRATCLLLRLSLILLLNPCRANGSGFKRVKSYMCEWTGIYYKFKSCLENEIALHISRQTSLILLTYPSSFPRVMLTYNIFCHQQGMLGRLHVFHLKVPKPNSFCVSKYLIYQWFIHWINVTKPRFCQNTLMNCYDSLKFPPCLSRISFKHRVSYLRYKWGKCFFTSIKGDFWTTRRSRVV